MKAAEPDQCGTSAKEEGVLTKLKKSPLPCSCKTNLFYLIAYGKNFNIAVQGNWLLIELIILLSYEIRLEIGFKPTWKPGFRRQVESGHLELSLFI